MACGEGGGGGYLVDGWHTRKKKKINKSTRVRQNVCGTFCRSTPQIGFQYTIRNSKNSLHDQMGPTTLMLHGIFSPQKNGGSCRGN